jgi:rRNA maturation endonuclease Nob1
MTRGTLTKVGWVWKCFVCHKLLSIAGDNIEPNECPSCGGYLMDAPVGEAKKLEREVLDAWERTT